MGTNSTTKRHFLKTVQDHEVSCCKDQFILPAHSYFLKNWKPWRLVVGAKMNLGGVVFKVKKDSLLPSLCKQEPFLCLSKSSPEWHKPMFRFLDRISSVTCWGIKLINTSLKYYDIGIWNCNSTFIRLLFLNVNSFIVAIVGGFNLKLDFCTEEAIVLSAKWCGNVQVWRI